MALRFPGYGILDIFVEKMHNSYVIKKGGIFLWNN